jgi:hypothetical protein
LGGRRPCPGEGTLVVVIVMTMSQFYTVGSLMEESGNPQTQVIKRATSIVE